MRSDSEHGLAAIDHPTTIFVALPLFLCVFLLTAVSVFLVTIGEPAQIIIRCAIFPWHQLAIAVSGIWINASEFFRNQVLLNSTWVARFESLGMTFPAAPLNAAVWMMWGFVFAGVLYTLSRKFTRAETTWPGWVSAFLRMWLVTRNLDVLPLPILLLAVPISLLESFLGANFCEKMSPNKWAWQSDSAIHGCDDTITLRISIRLINR